MIEKRKRGCREYEEDDDGGVDDDDGRGGN
jgi:hypothetical protein